MDYSKPPNGMPVTTGQPLIGGQQQMPMGQPAYGQPPMQQPMGAYP